MGVDKPDVKTILHACFPEGIDRFYQEVGRGGRDGQACTSLLVPTRRDLRVAQTMGPRLLRDPDKINGRWLAMWHSRRPVLEEDGALSTAVRVRTDVQPEHSFGQQSYAENVRWNKRLLLMMERAGMLRLEALQTEAGLDDEWVEWVTVRPMMSTFELMDDLANRLTESREDEIASIRRAMDSLVRHFGQQQAVCRELRSHYGEGTRRACGSCAFCRCRREQRVALVPLHLDDEAPVTVPSVQVVQAPSLTDPAAYPVLVQATRQLLQSGMCRRFVVPPEHRAALDAIFEHAERGFDQHYRIDDLEEGVAATIGPEERVIVFHVLMIDDRAGELNRHGHTVTHWLLGGNLDASPGRWPYMYEHGARPYPGTDGLTHWLHDQQRVQATQRALP